MNAKEADMIAWEMVVSLIGREIENPTLAGWKLTSDDEKEKLRKALNRCASASWDKRWRAERVLRNAEQAKADAKNCPCYRCRKPTGKPKPPYDRPIYCAECTAANVARWTEEGYTSEEIARLITPNYTK